VTNTGIIKIRTTVILLAVVIMGPRDDQR